MKKKYKYQTKSISMQTKKSKKIHIKNTLKKEKTYLNVT